MKDEEGESSASTVGKKEGLLILECLLGRGGGGGGGGGGVKYKYKLKLWVLAAILLLAFWSMFTGSVTLKWSTGNLNTLSGDFDSSINHDLDILEVEEREKLVRRMWDIYTQSKSIQLPKFWQVAFKAAYMDLINEVSNVRDAAFYEIAKMSLLRPSLLKQLQPQPILHSTSRASTSTTKEARLAGESFKTRRLQ